jgi:hypothetical protein
MKNILRSPVWLTLLAVLPLTGAPAGHASLSSAQPIKAGGQDGLAALAFPNNPQGSAFTADTDYPDIFTSATLGVETPSKLVRCEYRYTDKEGRLVYSAPKIVKYLGGEKSPPSPGRIFNHGREVLGLWLEGGTKLVVAKLSPDAGEFIKVGASLMIAEKSKPVTAIEVCDTGNDELEIVLLHSDGQGRAPAKNADDTESLYDGAGSFRGRLASSGLSSFRINLKLMQQVSAIADKTANDDVIVAGSRVLKVGAPGENLNGFVVTNSIGAMKYLPADARSHALPKVLHVFKNEREVLYHPAHGARGVSFGRRGRPTDGMLIGGERALYHYEFTGRLTKNGEPIFSEPKMILQENADLYAGSLAVPNIVDWDGDAVLDLIVGNSEGRLLFFKNNGSNASPDFGLPEEMKSDGNPIRFRPGYYIMQGPLEAAWGYLSPTVFDWNKDGLPDIVFSGSRAKFEVLINRGTKTKPELAAPLTLRIDGMELPGTWRVRPALAAINGRNAIVIMDTEDAMHLYWQVDDSTVEDGGKLLMADETTITHRSTLKQSLGQRGRAKIQLVDWDDDGVLDLIVGTSKRSAFPNPQRGMPFARYMKNELGLEVVYLRNVGTNKKMRFAEPLQFQVNGRDLYLGTHEYGPYACALGDTSAGLNLVVGVESGKLYFFARKDLTTIGFNDVK